MNKIRAQRGVVLLTLALLILLGAGVFLIKASPSKKRTIDSMRQEKTQKALIAAREALIAYATSAENRPGELPCPDVNNDGKIESEDGVGPNCASLRGWLPWFRLGLGDIRDGYGERLWYAIADQFRPYGSNPPIGLTLNPDTQTDIVIDGVNPTVPYVAAVIIAPGEVLSVNGNNRTLESGVSADDIVSSYLEENNQDADKTAYTSRATGEFNDTVSIITVDQIMEQVKLRVKQTVITQLKEYYGDSDNRFYPYAESIPGKACDGGSTALEGYLQFGTDVGCQYDTALVFPDWFRQNDWHRMFWYRLSQTCEYGTQDCAGAGAKITVDDNTGVNAVVIFSGKKLNAVSNECGTQVRPSDMPCDYFDVLENYDLDGIFEIQAESSTYNDELLIVD